MEHFKNKVRGSKLSRRGEEESAAGGLAGGVVGPVAVQSGDAPFNALAEAGKAAIHDQQCYQCYLPRD